MARAVIIQHVAFEDPGTLEPALRAEGFAIDCLQAGVDELRPLATRPPELLVVLGGPIGVYEHEIYPWLRDEITLIAQRLAERRPTLGICLGAQLMAAALGARVYAGGNGKEIGWSAIAPADGASADHPLQMLFEPGLEVLHWHGDTFDLPPGAVHLARSARYPNQAFAVGRHALAMQFHPEVITRQLERWYIGHAGELAQAQMSVPALREAGHRAGPRLESAAPALWRGWLHRAFSGDVPIIG